MITPNHKNGREEKEKEGKKRYQSPAIIHKGIISTRAGSPTFTDGSEGNAVDPADLFGNGS